MNKAKSSPSVQSTQPQRSELLRSIMAAKPIAEYYQKRDINPQIQNLAQQAIRVIVGAKVASLLTQNSPQRQLKKQGRAIPYRYLKYYSLTDTEVEKTLCKRRSERRENLFSLGIAGSGRRRSPGQGGRYKRDQNSRISC